MSARGFAGGELAGPSLVVSASKGGDGECLKLMLMVTKSFGLTDDGASIRLLLAAFKVLTQRSASAIESAFNLICCCALVRKNLLFSFSFPVTVASTLH